jgi:hypothetical protein
VLIPKLKELPFLESLPHPALDSFRQISRSKRRALHAPMVSFTEMDWAGKSGVAMASPGPSFAVTVACLLQVCLFESQ